MQLSCQKSEDKLVGKWQVFLVGFGNTTDKLNINDNFFYDITITMSNNDFIVYYGSQLCKNVIFDGKELSFNIGNVNLIIDDESEYIYSFYYRLKLNENSNYLNGECSFYKSYYLNNHRAINYFIKCKKIN